MKQYYTYFLEFTSNKRVITATKQYYTLFSGLISNNSETLREFLSNNATQNFRVHIKQLQKSLNNTEFLKDFLPDNSKDFFQCWNFQRVTSQ